MFLNKYRHEIELLLEEHTVNDISEILKEKHGENKAFSYKSLKTYIKNEIYNSAKSEEDDSKDYSEMNRGRQPYYGRRMKPGFFKGPPHMKPGEFHPNYKPFYNNRFKYKMKNPSLTMNFEYASNNPIHPSQLQPSDLKNLNNEAMMMNPQNPLYKKKLPNYRLLGRNIFDANVKNQFVKSRKKTNTYYSRFLKQHPTNNLPLAFQKSMSLAEDKALEEKEKQSKKSKKKKSKKDGSDSESDSYSSNNESNETDSNDKNSQKAHKFYSDISSDSELDTSKKKSKKKDKRKKKKKKKAKNKNDSAKSSDSSESESSNVSKFNDFAQGSDNDSDGSMMDLRENLKPIGDYMTDREQMLKEMLRCIRGSKLQAIIPDVLKDKPFHVIKTKCMEELEIMSKKRIRSLLEGKGMTSSSDTEESSDEGKSVKELQITTENYSSFSKFKPISDNNNKDKTDLINKTVNNETNIEGYDNQDSNLERVNSDTNLAQDTPQAINPQQSGFIAAGFKKFVKKSISIKIKTTDSSINLSKLEENAQNIDENYDDNYRYDLDDSDDYTEVRKELDSILKNDNSKPVKTNIVANKSDPIKTKHKFLNKINKSNLSLSNNNKYSVSNMNFNNNNNNNKNNNDTENSILNFVKQHQEHSIDNRSNYELNYDINTAESSCDYDYDLGDDLSNLDSDTEYKTTSNKKNKSKYEDSEGSTFNSSSSDSVDDDDDNDYNHKHLKNKKNSYVSDSSCDSLSSTEKNKKLSSKNKKKDNKTVKNKDKKTENYNKKNSKTKKRIKEKKVEEFESGNENESNENILYIKNTLKTILEMHIMNISDDDDPELKEILISLLDEIVNNDSITLEECAFIHEKINQLLMDENDNDVGSFNEEEEEGELDDHYDNNSKFNKKIERKKNKSDESSKNKKRKRKERSSDSINENFNNKKKSSSHHDNHHHHQHKHSNKKTNNNNNSSKKNSKNHENEDYLYNADGEMMEAGEIDDMYDDEIVVERELKNLLNRNI